MKFAATLCNVLDRSASSGGEKKSVLLLKKIAAELQQSAISRKSMNTGYGKIRSAEKCETPVKNPYLWGKDLIEAVKENSDFADNTSEQDKIENIFYNLFYSIPSSANNPAEVSQILLSCVEEKNTTFYWSHGKAPLKQTWIHVDNVFEKILAMHPDQENRESMTEFYSAVAELVWLIGNTQPLSRGSGSVAELFFLIAHFYHKIQPPVLKTDFPQLDVLDISFPLEDYKKLFVFFFEPETLPSCIRNPEMDKKIASLPRSEQLKLMYEHIKSLPDIALQSEFKENTGGGSLGLKLYKII